MASDWLAPLVQALLGQGRIKPIPITGMGQPMGNKADYINPITGMGQPITRTMMSDPDRTFNAEVGLPTPSKTMMSQPSVGPPPQTLPRPQIMEGGMSVPGKKLTVPPGFSYTGSQKSTGIPPRPFVGYGTEAEGHVGIGRPEPQVIYPGGALGGGEEYYGMQERWAPQVMGK